MCIVDYYPGIVQQMAHADDMVLCCAGMMIQVLVSLY